MLTSNQEHKQKRIGCCKAVHLLFPLSSSPALPPSNCLVLLDLATPSIPLELNDFFPWEGTNRNFGDKGLRGECAAWME
jgi:hypothetical protein